jgi:hypothetical protein
MCGTREADPAEPRGSLSQAWVRLNDPSGERAPLSGKPLVEHGVDPGRLRRKTAPRLCGPAVFAAPPSPRRIKKPGLPAIFSDVKSGLSFDITGIP